MGLDSQVGYAGLDEVGASSAPSRQLTLAAVSFIFAVGFEVDHRRAIFTTQLKVCLSAII